MSTLALATLFAALVCPPSPAAQTRTLNGELYHVSGLVTSFRTSAAGNRVLFLANPLRPFSTEGLYAAQTDGSSQPTLLRSAKVSGDYVIEPNGFRAVYRAESGFGSQILLYARATDGSGPELRLSGALPNGTVAGPNESDPAFSVSSDWTRAVFLVQRAGGIGELFSVPIDGSQAPLRLHPQLAQNWSVRSLSITPDGTRVVYRVALLGTNSTELRSVPIDGSAPPTLIASGNGFPREELTPDGSRVVFQFGQLFSVPTDGSAAPTPLGAAEHLERRFTPDGSRVVYLADQDTPDVYDLYSVPVDGSALPVRLSLSPPSGDVESDFQLTNDGACVVYRADSGTDGVLELHVVPVTGGTPLVLGGAATHVSAFRISTDRVVFRADPTQTGLEELYSVPLTGGVPVRLHASRAPYGFVGEFALRPDGTEVVFSGLVPGAQRYTLHVAPVDGSSLSLALPVSDEYEPLGALEITGDGRVVYRGSLGAVEDGAHLFSQPIDGSEVPSSLLPDLGTEFVIGRVSSFLLSSDGTHALYSASERNPRTELYRVDVRGTSASERLSHHALVESYVENGERAILTAFANGTELWNVPFDPSEPAIRLDRVLDARAPWLSPDGTRVAFLSRVQPPSLYVVPSDGSSAPTRLSAAAPSYVASFQASPDGSRLVFPQTPSSGAPAELYSVPSDGSQAAVRLSPPGCALFSFSSGAAYEISPDGARVVFVGDQDSLGKHELFSVPIDGNAPAVELSHPMIAHGDVGGGNNFSDAPFRISRDGQRVVFLADARFDGRTELYSVCIDGSQVRVVLGQVLTAQGDVWEYAISPDSKRVVYRANDELANVYELHSVPIQGGLVIELNGPLGGGRNVESFGISADSHWVVYHADQLVDEQFELFGVPIDGSRAAVRLNAPLASGSDVRGGSQITPDGGSVLFLDEQYRLYEAPVDGHAPAVSLETPPFVIEFAITRDSRRVVYRAQRPNEGVLELFSTRLTYAPTKLHGHSIR